jgi:hypothetical protein
MGGRSFKLIAAFTWLLLGCLTERTTAFLASHHASSRRVVLGPSITPQSSLLALSMAKEDDEKFGFGQRVESVKCLVLGLIVGSLVFAPFGGVHDLLLLNVFEPFVQTNNIAQWEFDTDMSGFQSGLFAIVYRYCVRTDDNPQLGQGVVGAFVLTRTLAQVVVPPYCSAVALNCTFL